MAELDSTEEPLDATLVNVVAVDAVDTEGGALESTKDGSGMAGVEGIFDESVDTGSVGAVVGSGFKIAALARYRPKADVLGLGTGK